MLDIMTAMALAAAAQAAPVGPAANPHTQHAQPALMDHSKMDQSKTGHKEGCCCCKKGAGGKMECAMSNQTGAVSAQQDHSGN